MDRRQAVGEQLIEQLRESQTTLVFYVNGIEVCVEQPNPDMTLLFFLRNNLNLTGTKDGCAGGNCGACTVMVSRYDRALDKIQHDSVNACLAPLCSMNGAAVTTVEGIGSMKTVLHPCQERIAQAHGSQCGFCTPGFVMEMYTLLRNNSNPSEEEIEGGLGGHLCRCTGYRPILDGFKSFSSFKCCGGTCEKSCKKQDTGSSRLQPEDHSSALLDARKLDPTQEPIFPPSLKLQRSQKPLVVLAPKRKWYSPVSLKQLLNLTDHFFDYYRDKQGLPSHLIVVGNTEIAIREESKKANFTILIDVSGVPELKQLEVGDEGVTVGASIAMNMLASKLKELKATLPHSKTKTFVCILDVLKQFASPQVKNCASIGGNICCASSVSDLVPILLAVGVKLNIASKSGQRRITMDSSFFKGNRKTAILPNEVLVSIMIPYTEENEYVCSYKLSRRRECDITIVHASFRVMLRSSDNNWIVDECSMAFGGLGDVPVVAKASRDALLGKHWCEKTVEDSCFSLMSEFQLPSNVAGGMPEFKMCLAASLLFKFYVTVTSQLPGNPLSRNLSSIAQPFHRDCVKGKQYYKTTSQDGFDTVGHPSMHLSALEQATGEAKYIDDIPRLDQELYAAPVFSTHAHAKIVVDTTNAVKMEGVVGYVDVNDVPGSNITGVGLDEEVFANGVVNCFGQIIGMILAKSEPQAKQAAKAVVVTYEDLESLITIEDAIAKDSYCTPVRTIKEGNFKEAYSNSKHTLEGEVRVGGQEHFYLETQCCIAIPKNEGGEMEIWSSTQDLMLVQEYAAKALGVPANRIVVKAKRLGGAFGGKTLRSTYLSNAVAVSANKFGVPVRTVLERSDDMISSGGRHPFLGKYKVGFSPNGQILALQVQLYANGGYSEDCSLIVINRATTHLDNVYNIPNIHITGRVCCTNLAPNTSFRGLGGPPSMLIMEQIIAHVASHLGLHTEQVQSINMYREGDVTPYGMVLKDCHIRKCWNTVKETSEFEKRKVAVDNYNRHNLYTKRGIALVPTKHGVGFSSSQLYQAGALLQVYTDGSVLLHHGGVEMGQGLNIKLVQICSQCLSIPPDRVYINETSTNTVANATHTGASTSTDLYGMAVKDCCDKIKERLEPIIEEAPKAGWNEWVNTAYTERVNLSAQGFYATPGVEFNWETGKGNKYNYFTYGACCSEVEIDTLTGAFTVIRSDIVMDAGNSINPAIDIGQIEGAFTQGLGLFTMEQCVYLEGDEHTQRGTTFTTSPAMYKIPTCSDIPIDLNVTLLEGVPNPKAIFSSKGVGEPPLFLAASVFFAIREAITAARLERGESASFMLDSPATCERIRIACVDKFTKKACCLVDHTAKRWNIDV